jgi:nitrous oxidase accessory protein NosD
MKSIIRYQLISALVILLLTMNGIVIAATITVPDDYTAVQQAVDAANIGDTVYVRSGTYFEHVTITKSLTLLGEDRETTIIDGGGIGDVMQLTVSDITVSGLTVRNGNRGVYCDHASNSNIIDTIVTHNYLRGVFLNYCPNSKISGSDVSDTFSTETYNGYGIALHMSNNSLIEDVRVSGSQGGRAFLPYHSSGTVIRNVEVFNNAKMGLFMGYGSYEVIGLNAHNNGQSGIYFNAVSNSTLRDSVLSNNGDNGIKLAYYSTNNIIEGNITKFNSVGGVGLEAPTTNNYIYHNDFNDNAHQVWDGEGIAGYQHWDNGYPSGGNYWSDYIGTDQYSGPGQDVLGSDGIGDLPYWLTASVMDRYPLMVPWNTVAVEIDIKPGSDPNSINLSSAGVVPIAILSTATFDAATVDPDTVSLAGAKVRMVGKSNKYLCHDDDVNQDGLIDLVCQVQTVQLLIEEGESTAVMEAKTYDGITLRGEDTIRIVPDN